MSWLAQIEITWVQRTNDKFRQNVHSKNEIIYYLCTFYPFCIWAKKSRHLIITPEKNYFMLHVLYGKGLPSYDYSFWKQFEGKCLTLKVRENLNVFATRQTACCMFKHRSKFHISRMQHLLDHSSQPFHCMGCTFEARWVAPKGSIQINVDIRTYTVRVVSSNRFFKDIQNHLGSFDKGYMRSQCHMERNMIYWEINWLLLEPSWIHYDWQTYTLLSAGQTGIKVTSYSAHMCRERSQLNTCCWHLVQIWSIWFYVKTNLIIATNVKNFHSLLRDFCFTRNSVW